MVGLSKLEDLTSQILGLFTKKAYNANVTTGADYVLLSTGTSGLQKAQTVYISAQLGDDSLQLLVRTNGVDFILPNGSIFPLQHINNLDNISVKVSDGSALTITFRYEC